MVERSSPIASPHSGRTIWRPLRSTCSITAIAYGTGAPVVLTVNSTGGSLAELRPS